MTRASTPVSLTVTMCTAQVFGIAGMATFPALLPTFFDVWGLSNTEAGWINGMYFAGYLVVVPVLTALTDRMAPRRIYFLCMAISGLSSLGFAVFAEGFWTALILRTIAGIGFAGIYMPGLKLLNDHIVALRAEGDHSRPVVFFTSSFGIGMSLSYLFAGEVTAALDWRWAFGLTALGPLLATVLTVVMLPPRDPHPAKRPDTHLLDFRPVLRCHPAMGYVLAYTAHNFELFAFRSWLVAYLVFAAGTGGVGLSAGGGGMSATALAALINLLGVPASVLGNELSRRIGRARAVSMIMLVSAVIAAFLGFAAALPLWMVVGLCMVYGVMVTGDSGSITAGVIAAAPEGYRGATMAVHSCIGFIGSAAGPLAFGVALDLTGGGATVSSWGIAFAAMAAVAVLGPLALAVLGRAREHKA